MAKPYSMDLRERVLRAREDGLTQQKIADRFDISISTVESWLRRFREEGSIEPRPHGGGQRPAVDAEGTVVLNEIIGAENDLTLAEYIACYYERTGVMLSRSTISRTLIKLGITRKKSH
jgi:putative transposase